MRLAALQEHPNDNILHDIAEPKCVPVSIYHDEHASISIMHLFVQQHVETSMHFQKMEAKSIKHAKPPEDYMAEWHMVTKFPVSKTKHSLMILVASRPRIQNLGLGEMGRD